MDGDWKIQINSLDYKLESHVFIYRFAGNMIHWVEFKSPELVIHSEPYREGGADQVKPAFVARRDEAFGIAKAFVSFANSQGIKNGEETFVKGKLEATEKHLEDMRNLVFKKV